MAGVKKVELLITLEITNRELHVIGLALSGQLNNRQLQREAAELNARLMAQRQGIVRDQLAVINASAEGAKDVLRDLVGDVATGDE
jgi:hypothetical protein